MRSYRLTFDSPGPGFEWQAELTNTNRTGNCTPPEPSCSLKVTAHYTK